MDITFDCLNGKTSNDLEPYIKKKNTTNIKKFFDDITQKLFSNL